MGGVPAYAAVSESVEQVRNSGSRAAAGMVNAVLRRVARAPSGRSAFPDPETDLEGHLTTWGSHPEWLVRRWLRAFGRDGTRALVGANNREPDIYLRPIGTSARDAAAVLAEAGLLDPGGGVGCREECWIRLRSGANPAEALGLVPGVIQDPAASLVVEYASPGPGSLVADLCAAPGGKALALSETARGCPGRRPLRAPARQGRRGPEQAGGSRPGPGAALAGGGGRTSSAGAPSGHRAPRRPVQRHRNAQAPPGRPVAPVRQDGPDARAGADRAPGRRLVRGSAGRAPCVRYMYTRAGRELVPGREFSCTSSGVPRRARKPRGPLCRPEGMPRRAAP